MSGKSGLRAVESWDDGVDHAKEHIFMDLFDKADEAAHAGKPDEAVKLMDDAYQWTEESKLASSSANQSPRFIPRYRAMIKYRLGGALEVSKTAVKTLKNICEMLLAERNSFLSFFRQAN